MLGCDRTPRGLWLERPFACERAPSLVVSFLGAVILLVIVNLVQRRTPR
jgi:uncharacterized membrane protein YeaQ/YmgE (transglycosylase-associated protein family)